MIHVVCGLLLAIAGDFSKVGQSILLELVPLWPQHESLGMLVATVELQELTVQYQVTFEADWSSTTHPDQFPPNPHFSGLIGTTHHGDLVLWQAGMLATPGVKSMAETGSKSPLDSEIMALVTQDLAGELLSGGGIGISPGSVMLTFTVDRRYPLVSLVSMIAPSPDWFVGVHGTPFFNENGWANEVSINLFPYDAGTDSGPNYLSPNQATLPAESIFRITGMPFLNGATIAPLGRFVFTRILQ